MFQCVTEAGATVSCRDDSPVCFLEQDTEDQLDWILNTVINYQYIPLRIILATKNCTDIGAIHNKIVITYDKVMIIHGVKKVQIIRAGLPLSKHHFNKSGLHQHHAIVFVEMLESNNKY